MKFVASIHTFSPEGAKVSRRRIFRNSANAMRFAEKAARKSLRRFAPASQNMKRENWGFRVGAFPYFYVRTVVTLGV